MKNIFTASIIFSLMSSVAFTAEIKSLENVEWKWVEILNKSASNGNAEFGVGKIIVGRNGRPYLQNTCGIGGSSNEDQFDNRVKVIGELSDGEYIFEYFREGQSNGTPCPSGVFFKAKLEDFTK